MKKYITALIITCIGTILIGLNTKEHNPPLEEQPVAVVETVVEPLPVEPVPEPIPVVETIVEPPKPVAQPTGSCADWMAQAGIPLTEATQTLILKESGCRTNAINPSSGACGIPQAYPCSKLPCPLDNSGAVCQLQWMDTYVKNRYGSWENALSTWYSRCGSAQGCWY